MVAVAVSANNCYNLKTSSESKTLINYTHCVLVKL